MNTLLANSNDYEAGLVTEAGFKALLDAEMYDQVTSIRACSNCLSRIRQGVDSGKSLHLYRPNLEPITVTSVSEFSSWAQLHFPNSYRFLVKHGL